MGLRRQHGFGREAEQGRENRGHRCGPDRAVHRRFLGPSQSFQERMEEILTGNGQDTGLLDANGNDIFAGSFTYLLGENECGETVVSIYRDIMKRLFNNPAGGQLILGRVKGDSGEIVFMAGAGEEPFGLINVGDAKALSDHMEAVATEYGTQLSVDDSDFTEAMFASVKDLQFSRQPADRLQEIYRGLGLLAGEHHGLDACGSQRRHRRSSSFSGEACG